MVGLLLIAGLIFNLSMLPYPMWFEIASLVALVVAVVFGGPRERAVSATPSPTLDVR